MTSVVRLNKICFFFAQGNIKIHSNTGNVVGDKRFIGNNLEINTNSGDIRVASSYAEHVRHFNLKLPSTKGI